jgi:hypothetical protein
MLCRGTDVGGLSHSISRLQSLEESEKRLPTTAALPAVAMRLFVLCLFLLTITASAFVYENDKELTDTGDFDGDGRTDIVIVDRVTGNYRLGYQLSAGVHTWAKVRASGVENVTGLAIGRLLNTTRDSLAFTSPEVNRVNVLDVTSTTSAGVPISVFPDSIGPSLATAIDIGGGGNTPHHDLFVASLWNGSPSQNRLNLVRNDGTTFSPISTFVIAQPLARGNRVKIKTNEIDMVGAVFRGPMVNSFGVYNLSSGVAVTVAFTNGLPLGVDYVHAAFNGGSPHSQFVFYKPGESNLLVRPITEPVVGTFAFGALTTFNLGKPMHQVFALPGASDTKLLVLFGDGETAAIYNFNGVAAPTLVQDFTAPPGELFTGIAALGNSNFMFFSGDGISKLSSKFHNWSFNGTSYVAGTSGNLASLTSLSVPSNVLLFRLEPFVNSNPILLGSLNAGDWASGLTLGGGVPPNVSVTTETFLGTAQGLGGPAPLALGQAPLTTQHGLVNQYSNAISLFSYTRPVGSEIAEVHISPAPGLYQTGVQIKLTPADPATQVWYRTNLTDAWTLYGGPFSLFKNASVHYYAKPVAGTTKSTIRTAAYQFAIGPSQLDSDGDGVPDYVEISKGLDPKSGNDHDKDGYFDLDEITSGFDPNNALNHPPTNHVRLELKASFDLIQTPRPFDGTITNQSLAVTGVVMRAFDLQGGILSVGACSNLGLAGVTNPAARLSNIVTESQARLIVAATEQHYDIATAGADKRIGREMLGLVAVPDLPPPLNVPYVYGGGNLTTEANAWIVAASNAVHNLPRELVKGDLDIYDTLVALLVEKKVGELLLSRGQTNGSNITFFPFRPTDVSRINFPQTELLALELISGGQPGYLLQNIHGNISNSVQAAVLPAVQNLKKVTADIYRISSASNNIPSGCTNCPVYPSPVDTLRDFLYSGVLESNYLAHTSVSAPDRTSALSGVSAILAAVGGRPTTNIILRVRPDSFSGGCTTLETTDALTLMSLFHFEGTPFTFPESFDLATGSLVDVHGYTDIVNAGCSGSDIEVITIKLLAVPAVSGADLDGDLLFDDWEALFGDGAFGDSDGDGFSTLQEMFDGTDPNDPLSHTSTIADLTPPAISIEIGPGGSIVLDWGWSAAYENRIRFGVRYTDALGTTFTDELLPPTALGGGQYEINLTNPGTAKRFYTVFMVLR